MSYRQDPRDQYYNNGSINQSGPYQQGQFSNSRMQNDGYRPPIRNPYPTPNPNIKGPSYGRTANDDDNASISSSVYSQPSDVGFATSNNMRYYQEQSLETTEPRRQSLLYNEYDYPPSPFAASTNTHNSAGLTAGSSQQGLPLIDKNENRYMVDNNMEENYYQDYSQNTQPQFDVYNDFNNNFQSDEKYDGEESRNNTLTGPVGAHDPNLFTMNDGNFSVNGKGSRQSASANCVVTKKERRCAFCSRKTCVIITFIILILLAIGLYFVWPRIPVPAGNAGNAKFTTGPNMEFQFQLDNTQNWLSYKFNSLDLNVYDATNVVLNRPIASGTKKGFTIPGRAISTISVPIVPSQIVPTLQNFTSTCTSSDLQLRVDITMLIFGLDWVKKPTTTIPVVYLQCPSNATQSEDNQSTSTTPTPTSAEVQPATTSAPTDGSTPGGTAQSGTTSAPGVTTPSPAPTDGTTAPGAVAPVGTSSTDGATPAPSPTSTDGAVLASLPASTDTTGTTSTAGAPSDGTTPTPTSGGN